MLDIDHFKHINDRHGHLAGDAVLREIAAVVRESTRSEDLVCRFGGEEFVVVLPFSDPDLAGERAEQIRSSIASRTTHHDGAAIRVTASIGLAYAPAELRKETALIMLADQALYRAKAEGRNRVVLAFHPSIVSASKTESAEFAPLMSP